MNKEVFKIISETCLKHRDTGESSVFSETRRIMQALKETGYDIVANEPKTSDNRDVCPICKGELSCIPCTKKLCSPLQL